MIHQEHVAYIGIGSNMGDRGLNLCTALSRLAPAFQIMQVSPCYESEPWGLTDQPSFLNLVCSGHTALSPRELLGFLKGIESGLGRVPSVRWGPRLIDLDILFFDEIVMAENDLIIPHPSLHKRAFVVVPLADIVPDLVHPILMLSMRQMAGAVKETLRAYPDSWYNSEHERRTDDQAYSCSHSE